MSDSRDPKFDPGEILMMMDPSVARLSPVEIVSSYNRHEDPDLFDYDVWISGRVEKEVPERYLRMMTAWERLFFRHPQFGHLMMGRNSILGVTLATVGSSFLIWGAFCGGDTSAWPWPVGIALGAVATHFIGSHMQYLGKWK